MAQPAPSYEESVFINCPYDPEYADLFCAVILTTVAYGFEPRSAREAEHRSETRFVRITEALTHSKYSIHDLSRFTGEGVDNIARFNMPLELGFAMALKIERQATAGRPHNWLVLVPGSYEYQPLRFRPGRIRSPAARVVGRLDHTRGCVVAESAGGYKGSLSPGAASI
jgi:hypothetical protein